MRCRSQALLAAVLCAWLMPAIAALPPQAYIAKAQQAPDAVRLKVLSVDRQVAGRVTEITLQGEVIEVRRSESGLTPRDRIEIRYSIVQRPPDVVGPGQPGIPAEGEVVCAFLHHVAGTTHYSPAAGGATFSEWVWNASGEMP